MKIFKWLVLVLIRPALMLFIVMNGLPPTIRAVGSVVKEVAKLFR